MRRSGVQVLGGPRKPRAVSTRRGTPGPSSERSRILNRYPATDRLGCPNGPLAQRQSCGLLIHRFGVRVPGGLRSLLASLVKSPRRWFSEGAANAVENHRHPGAVSSTDRAAEVLNCGSGFDSPTAHVSSRRRTKTAGGAETRCWETCQPAPPVPQHYCAAARRANSRRRSPAGQPQSRGAAPNRAANGHLYIRGSAPTPGGPPTPAGGPPPPFSRDGKGASRPRGRTRQVPVRLAGFHASTAI